MKEVIRCVCITERPADDPFGAPMHLSLFRFNPDDYSLTRLDRADHRLRRPQKKKNEKAA